MHATNPIHKAIDLLSSDNEFIYEGAVKEVRDFRNVNRYLYLLSEVLLICRAKKSNTHHTA